MPQMAPMNWLFLMFYFLLIFILFNSMNYYSFIYFINSDKMSKKSLIKINWKW